MNRLFIVLSFVSVSIYGQETTISPFGNVCVGSTITYSFGGYIANDNGTCKLTASNWIVTGGTIIDNFSYGLVSIKWTSLGTKTISVTATATDSSFPGQCTSKTPFASLTINNVPSAPLVNLTTPFGQNTCSLTNLTISCDNSNSTLKKEWLYRPSSVSSYAVFKSTLTSSTTFNVSDLSVVYGEKVYFKVRLRPCSETTNGSTTSGNISTTFYQPPPDINNLIIVPNAPTYSCSTNASVDISNFVYPPGTNSLKVSVLNAEGTEGFNDVINPPSSILNISKSGFFISGEEYTLVIENENSTCASETRKFTIPFAAAFVVNTPTILKPISCNSSISGANNDGKITVTVTNGKPNYNYLLSKDGGIFKSVQANTNVTSYTYTGLGKGTYEVKVTDACGITVTSSTTVTLSEPTAISISSANISSQLSCPTSSDGEITVLASGGTDKLQYYLNSNTAPETSNIIGGLSAGIHAFTVKDVNNCSTIIAGEKLVAPPIITVSNTVKKAYNGFNIRCAGESNGEMTVTANGGTGTLQYYLDGKATPEASNVISGLAAGGYTFIIRDANNCPTSSQSFTLTEPPVLNISGIVTSNFGGFSISCNGGSDGQITLTGSGGAGALQYSIDGVNYYSIKEFNNLSSGDYSISVQDINGCTLNGGDLKLTAPSPIAAAETLSNYNGVQISCNGALDGSITLSNTGGTGTYTYSWSSGQDTQSISGLGAGSYTVTITDTNSCTKKFTYELTEPFAVSENVVVSDFNGSNISCNGAGDGAIDLAVSGGTTPYTYLWSTGATTQDISSIGSGIYSILITDANNCSKTISNIEITEPDALSVAVGSSINIACFGNATGQVTLSALGGGTGKQYSLDGVNYQASSIFSNLVAGAYTFDVTDANGCNNQVNITLTEPPLLTGTIGSVQNSSCGDFNGTATIDVVGGVSSYFYTWRDATSNVVGNTSVLTGVGGGIYEVTVTDANGCSIMQSANISSIDGPQTTAAAVTPTTCFNSNDGSATLNIIGASPFDVAWANGETGLAATSLQPGNNSVVITDANGCVAVEVVTVPSPSAIDLSNVSQTAPTCYNSTDGAIIVDATGGSGSYSYAWSNGTSGNQLSGGAQGIYTLTITDSNGCTLVQDIELNGVEPITTTLVSETIPTCKNGTDGSLEVEALGGNGNYTYAWSNGQFGSTLSAIGAGLYDVTITDVLGCTLVQTFDLSDADPFVIDPFNDIIEICTGSSYKANYSLNNASYTWTSANGFTSTSNEVVLNQAGNYTLTVINENGCMAQDNFELVLSNDLLNADFLLISEAYVGDTVFIVDISWPVPDLLDWEFANNVTVLEQGEDYAAVVFNEPDIYAINMTVQLADCSDFYIQSINILDRSEKEDINGRISGDQELIQRFDIYPNPNYGNFQINIELSQTTGAQVQLIDLQRNRIILDNTYKDELIYSIEVNRIDLSAGLYLVTLKVQDEFKARRIMIR